jgi:chromosome condensin MukBEF MukE localization factor
MNFLDKRFAEIDLLLRRGGHVNRSSLDIYEWLCDNFAELKLFYAGFSAILEQHPDGFFYLTVPGTGAGIRIRSRLLPKSCVHLGTFIALKARDPEITRSSGRITVSQLLTDIETTVPRDVLQKVYAPKHKESILDTRIAAEINNALKTLAELCFIELRGDTLKPLEAINRFAELARHDNAPDEAARIQMELGRGVVFLEAAEDEEIEEDNDEQDESQD